MKLPFLGCLLFIYLINPAFCQSSRALSRRPSQLRGASTNVAPQLPGYSQCFKWCYWYFRGRNFYSCLQANNQCYKCGPMGGRYAPDLCGTSYSNLFCCTTDTPDCCGGSCVDFAGDAQNCGACGRTCATGQVCHNGVCTATTSCKTGFTLCGNKCVDTRNNARHCNACDNACPVDKEKGIAVCVNSVCGFSGPVCPTNQKRCGATCVSLSSDPNNCGFCGHTCSGNSACYHGRCQCLPGFGECSLTTGPDCETALNTVQNCGGCGRQCGANQACINGECECDANYADIDQDPSNGCEVDLLTSSTHCGSPDFTCAESCVSGQCTCTPPLLYCSSDGSCTNPLTDSKHCGGCGNECNPGLECRGGTCSTICSDSAPDYCPNSEHICVDLQTDPNNCGVCGTVCLDSEVCTAGACVT